MLIIGQLILSPSAWGANSGRQDNVVWNAVSKFDDGRQFLTDGSFLLDSRYAPAEDIPKKNIPPQSVQRLLDSKTDHDFGFADLGKTPTDHYLAPGPIQLNRIYVDYLRKTSLSGTLRFKAGGQYNPVLILDGDKVVGVVMPMKM